MGKKKEQTPKRLYIRSIEPKRRSCKNCGIKFPVGECQWTAGEYINAKWNKVQDFCVSCFEEIRAKIKTFIQRTDRAVEYEGYRGEKLPGFMTGSYIKALKTAVKINNTTCHACGVYGVTLKPFTYKGETVVCCKSCIEEMPPEVMDFYERDERDEMSRNMENDSGIHLHGGSDTCRPNVLH